jgi:SAM-dependent methyltransferase
LLPDDDLLALLRCPQTREPLHREGSALVTRGGGRRYRINLAGVALLAGDAPSADGAAQEQHYDRVAVKYLENLAYPHTQEYTRYLDDAVLREVPGSRLGTVAEICCGRGEAFQLLGDRIDRGIGVDMSVAMLEAGARETARPTLAFVQGDATRLPLASSAFDNVIMFGGIHHVNDRRGLFAEIGRILKPGGRFYWREPVSDFLPWRAARAIIYGLSPALDAKTERPLIYRETVPPLERAGFKLLTWKTYGFVGFCLLMNSDVLVLNRLFRFVPGIRAFTRFMTRIDDATLSLPGMAGAGLQVVGVAEKPGTPS